MLRAARALIGEFAEATTSAAARELLRLALAAAENDDGYHALKIARRVMRHEDEVLGHPPASPCRTPAPASPGRAPSPTLRCRAPAPEAAPLG